MESAFPGDKEGLYFCVDNSFTSYYHLSLDGQGMFRLYECQACIAQNSRPVSVSPSELVSINSPGQPNTVTIIVLNTAIDLYINAIFVKQFDGSAVTNPDSPGLYAILQNSSSQIIFSDVKIWNLDSSQP
jgi:hypothetical protein